MQSGCRVFLGCLGCQLSVEGLEGAFERHRAAVPRAPPLRSLSPMRFALHARSSRLPLLRSGQPAAASPRYDMAQERVLSLPCIFPPYLLPRQSRACPSNSQALTPSGKSWSPTAKCASSTGSPLSRPRSTASAAGSASNATRCVRVWCVTLSMEEGEGRWAYGSKLTDGEGALLLCSSIAPPPLDKSHKALHSHPPTLAPLPAQVYYGTPSNHEIKGVWCHPCHQVRTQPAPWCSACTKAMRTVLA